MKETRAAAVTVLNSHKDKVFSKKNRELYKDLIKAEIVQEYIHNAFITIEGTQRTYKALYDVSDLIGAGKKEINSRVTEIFNYMVAAFIDTCKRWSGYSDYLVRENLKELYDLNNKQLYIYVDLLIIKKYIQEILEIKEEYTEEEQQVFYTIFKKLVNKLKK